ncbi:MAG: hypothetical protein ACK58C_07675 [Betaproteobacteria bacterium]|jgi:hypothetical protein
MLGATSWFRSTWWLPLSLMAACSVVPERADPTSPPVVAQVLGKALRANGAGEMQHLILRELTDRYAAEHGIVVSQAEVDTYVARQREVLAADPNVRLTPDSPEDAATREQVARARLLQLKIDGALQRQYGGRVAARTGGAVPVDAYRRFLEEQAAQGRFRIFDVAGERAFWRAWSDDTRWQFLPEGSEAAARAFDPAPSPR